MPEDFRLGNYITNAFLEERANIWCKKKRWPLCMWHISRGRGRDLSDASHGAGAVLDVSPADRRYLYFQAGKTDGQGNSQNGPKSHSKEVLWLCPCLATPHVHLGPVRAQRASESFGGRWVGWGRSPGSSATQSRAQAPRVYILNTLGFWA